MLRIRKQRVTQRRVPRETIEIEINRPVNTHRKPIEFFSKDEINLFFALKSWLKRQQ